MNDHIESHEDSENGDYDFDDNFIQNLPLYIYIYILYIYTLYICIIYIYILYIYIYNYL